MSSQPIRNNGHQSLDFCWNDGEGNTLSPGVAKWIEWKPGAIFAIPRKETQNKKANKKKLRAKKWRQIYNLFIFTPQAWTFQFSHMYKSREKSITNHRYPTLSFLLFLLLECCGGGGRLEYLKVFRRHHVISSTHTLILKPALKQLSHATKRFLSNPENASSV